jgi:hypothetical protein
MAVNGRIGFDEREFWGADADLMSYGAGIEWIMDERPISFAFDIDYYDGDGDWGGPSDVEFTNLQVGLRMKIYFGTSGSLANHHRTSTLDSNLGPTILEFSAFED